ncbi:MAG: DeoR/GlpR family DNA-binding transcription regulator [Rectinemataceae bacterium]
MKKELVFVEERKRGILEYVVSQKKASVSELCERFEVSSATIRSDLRDLEQSGALVRTHGGAIVRRQARFEPDARAKEEARLAEKRAIARAALDCVEDGDTIVLDTGSTTYELACLLDEKRDITVLTNDLAIALRLEEHPSAAIHLIGGVVRKRFHCAVGTHAAAALQGLTVDKAFMAANSFSLEKGASTPDLQQAELKKLMVSMATKVYLLVDSSKLGKNSFAQFAAPGAIDCLVTDAIGPDELKTLDELGIEILLAPLADAPGPNTKGERT